MDLLYSARQYNGFVNVDQTLNAAFSLGGSIEMNYHLVKKPDDFKFGDRLSIPFVSFFSQSGYISNTFTGSNSTNSIGDIFKTGKFAGPNVLFRIKNTLFIEKKISLKHHISFVYDWDYFIIRSSRSVKQANHQLGVLYRYTL